FDRGQEIGPQGAVRPRETGAVGLYGAEEAAGRPRGRRAHDLGRRPAARKSRRRGGHFRPDRRLCDGWPQAARRRGVRPVRLGLQELFERRRLPILPHRNGRRRALASRGPGLTDFAPADLRWLEAAARIAMPYRGTTAENPTVGAVVVSSDGIVL